MSKRSKKQAKPFVPKTVKAPATSQRDIPPPAPRTTVRGTVEVTSDAFLSKLSPEAQAKLETRDRMMKEVLKFVEENPEEASRLLRAWLTRKE
ncbi:MAG: hypothetical protein JSU77_13010 [Fidelibacterota bacterium]|nr:MAG: hypothetical protein JSU77_13010 [Candidatus Neomarinimicrobiota bacterium]